MMNKDDLHNSNQHRLDTLSDGLKDAEHIAQLEHMLDCEACLDAFSDALTSEGLEEMPAYLEEEILASIYMGYENETETENPAGVQSQKSRPAVWLSLLGYSTKIGFAAACAILMLFHLPDLNRKAEWSVSDREEALQEQADKTVEDETEYKESAYEWNSIRENVWNEAKERRQGSYTVDVLEFITSKIFDGGIENEQEKE